MQLLEQYFLRSGGSKFFPFNSQVLEDLIDRGFADVLD